MGEHKGEPHRCEHGFTKPCTVCDPYTAARAKEEGKPYCDPTKNIYGPLRLDLDPEQAIVAEAERRLHFDPVHRAKVHQVVAILDTVSRGWSLSRQQRAEALLAASVALVVNDLCGLCGRPNHTEPCTPPTSPQQIAHYARVNADLKRGFLWM